MGKKKCNKCGKLLPLECFYKELKSPDGLRYNCKDCHKIYRKEYHIKNKAQENRKNSKWRGKNLNLDRGNKVKYGQTPSGIYSRLQARSRKNGTDISITREEFISWHDKQEQSCVYCGISQEDLHKVNDSSNSRSSRLSVDRIDNNKGYVIGNICLCCIRCNFIKNDFFNEDEMKKVGEIVADVWRRRV